MSDAHGVTKENLLFAFPSGLRENPSLAALGDVTAEALAKRPAEIALLAIYPRIEELPEDLLDILARDFKVDWWDINYDLAEKRRTLKDSWRVHKMLGTKAAVETAISAIYPHTRVLEWFEYGGEPYHFKLDINITNDTINSEKQRRVLERMNFYKSLRSHNDGVTYFVEAKPAVVQASGYAPGLWETIHTPMELPIPIIQPEAAARAVASAGIWEAIHVPLGLPVPIVEREAVARVGGSVGLLEAFTAAAELPALTVRGRASVRIGAAAAIEETHTTRASLPAGEPVRSRARLYAAASSVWQECYRTGSIALADTVLIASAQAKAAGGTASTQETAMTHIKLQEAEHARAE